MTDGKDSDSWLTISETLYQWDSFLVFCYVFEMNSIQHTVNILFWLNFNICILSLITFSAVQKYVTN